ncbi:MAG: electron transfer flavoprotein subunit beta/FixA family protein [Arthrobacter sp.]
MRIIVLIKEVPDTYGERRLNPATGWIDRDSVDRVIDEIDERALEVALSFKDTNKGTEIVAVAMGPASVRDSLRRALSMGADRAVHVLDGALEGADALLTARTLAAVIRTQGADLVIAGNESTDGAGGVVPAMISELLDQPLLGGVGDIGIAPASVRGTRITAAYSAVLSAPLPAVISVAERVPEARFPNFKGIMGAKRKPIDVVGAADLGIEPRSGSTVLSVLERPARSGGRILTDQGDAGSAIVDLLRERKAI